MSRNTRLAFLDTDYRYGYHISKESTLLRTVEKVSRDTPFSAFQTYIASPRAYAPPDCGADDIIATRKALHTYDLNMFIHGCLMYNLCGAANHRKDPKFASALKRTCDGLVTELDIAAGLGCRGVVVHPNSCHDKEKGLFTASQTIENVLTRNTPYSSALAKRLGITQKSFKLERRIILENSAHEGDKRGWSLEELASMINGVREDLRCQIGICIDTAHAFGAGIYDWGRPSEVTRFYDDFDRIIGLEHLYVFHLNDSRCSTQKGKNAYFGSRKDRHENLGLGYIFGDLSFSPSPEGSRMKGLKEFFLQARRLKIPIIGEPPAKSESGGPGLGGRRDWGVVCTLLENTEFPLEKVYLP